MSVSQKDLSDSLLRMEIVETYEESSKTMQEVADEMGTGLDTVRQVLKEELSEEVLGQLKSQRYAESKTGEKNPRKGKRPGNYKGECSDGRGYRTMLVRGKRYYLHRIVMAETILKISVEHLPDHLPVHHIDGNPLNNHPDNLALCTKAGHVAIHQRMKFTNNELVLRGLTLVEPIQYITSK